MPIIQENRIYFRCTTNTHHSPATLSRYHTVTSHSPHYLSHPQPPTYSSPSRDIPVHGKPTHHLNNPTSPRTSPQLYPKLHTSHNGMKSRSVPIVWVFTRQARTLVRRISGARPRGSASARPALAQIRRAEKLSIHISTKKSIYLHGAP